MGGRDKSGTADSVEDPGALGGRNSTRNGLLGHLLLPAVYSF